MQRNPAARPPDSRCRGAPSGLQKPNEMRGQFITFEGGEGAGKSTQASALAKKLAGMGIGTVLTREPGGSPGGEIIRHVVLSGFARPLGPELEALLFAAARADHVDTLIKPALARGRWVVCDRFHDSTQVYQGVLGNVSRPILKGLEKLALGDLRPDLTLILDVPPEVGMARAAERRGEGEADRFEGENLAFHQALNGAFREIAARDPDRCVLIDANRPKERIAADIWRLVRQRLHPEMAPLALEEIGR
jgi:dTMP kinase